MDDDGERVPKSPLRNSFMKDQGSSPLNPREIETKN